MPISRPLSPTCSSAASARCARRWPRSATAPGTSNAEATMPILQSLIADRWIGSREGAALASAIDGATIHHAHADEIDFGEALAFARRTGGASLLALDFQQRAARLKALAAYLKERKEELYAISP